MMADKAPDAIEMLTHDHGEVRKLFKGFEDARKPESKRAICVEIRDALEAHTALEEEFFYPAAKEANSELVAEALKEHEVVASLLSDLAGLDPAAEDYDATMKVLMENVEHHAGEEEAELFPKTRKALGADQLRELGARMTARRQETADKLGSRSAA
jgi:hemerythrin superfamily protein